MLEADQAYLSENVPTITRRQLFVAALFAVIMPKPVRPPVPPTCEGMTTQMLGMAHNPRTIELVRGFLCSSDF
jgi:hypothetical protein